MVADWLLLGHSSLATNPHEACTQTIGIKKCFIAVKEAIQEINILC